MPKLLRRRHAAPQPKGGSGDVKGVVAGAPGDARPSKSGKARAASVATPDAGPSVDFAQIGEQVAIVLEAARQAAEKIRVEADAEAQRIRTASEEQARVALEKAKTTVERADAQAATVRADTEQQSKEVREQADEYASETRQAADVKAAAVLARAEKQASTQERTLQDRRRSLDEGVVRTEERLKQLSAGLHELAGGLEELVAPEDHGENRDTGSLLNLLNQAVGEPPAQFPEGGTSVSASDFGQEAPSMRRLFVALDQLLDPLGSAESGRSGRRTDGRQPREEGPAQPKPNEPQELVGADGIPVQVAPPASGRRHVRASP